MPGHCYQQHTCSVVVQLAALRRMHTSWTPLCCIRSVLLEWPLQEKKIHIPARNRVTWDGKYMYSQLEPGLLLSDNQLIRRMRL